MNREDIIEMWKHSGGVEIIGMPFSKIEAFAALVASAERERLTDAAMKSAEKAVEVAMALEREACANIVESDPSYDWHKFACEAANAIRARGQA